MTTVQSEDEIEDLEPKKKRFKFTFPSAISVLFIVMIFAAALTYLIPAGKFATLSYSADADSFVITSATGEESSEPATQETLDKLGVTTPLESLTDGSLTKPVAIPGTYEKLDPAPQGWLEFLISPITGVYDTIDIILFVFILGGCMGVLNAMGAMTAAVGFLSKATKGHEWILIVVISLLITAGGTTFGMAEETIAFYPILMPVFLAAGYDAMTCIATIFASSCLGTMFSTVNPFAIGVATKAAGISMADGMSWRFIALAIGTVISIGYIIAYGNRVKADPSKSVCFDMCDKINARWALDSEAPAFTWRMGVSLAVFFGSFVVLVWGIVAQQWWFDYMTAVFLSCAIILLFTSGMPEATFMDTFIAGCADLMSVALVVGVARAVNVLLEDGMVSDTILQLFSGTVAHLGPVAFILMMLVIFIVLGFFINSSSGLAVLSIPIMSPLADVAGVSRAAIIAAYNYGQGLISYLTPTGLILASLAMVEVPFSRWLKFSWPLISILSVLCAVLLILQAAF